MTKMEDFIAGNSKKCYEYSCFIPSLVNHEWTWETQSLTVALEKAVRALASLDACSQFVPDIDLFIRMHIINEASASSRIEGTQTEMEEVLLPEMSIEEERRNDWREVNNYVNAMNSSIEALKKLPLSIRLLCNAHRQLLVGVRGKYKCPGEIRTTQNWIGGHSIATAKYIPPAAEFVRDLLSDLEMFWHNEDIKVSKLIRCAISHYQFESIHPFLDGNGRIGRLLIPFYLICEQELTCPSLYISSYFERNRDLYYESLSRVRTDNDLIGWVLFFLDAIKETAQTGCNKFKQIFSLRDEMNMYSHKCPNTALTQKLFKNLYSIPRMTINQVSELVGCSYLAANRLVKKMENDGILVPATDAKRNVVYDFRRYLEIFKN